jgi:imidazolonepropionase-like amidohydrolase
MDRDTVLRGHAVLVRDQEIAAVGPVGTVEAPDGARIVDGAGGWLLPGLVDGHVHVNADDLDDYVRHGVTTVRNMWGWPGLRELIEEIEDGSRVGPRIFSYSPGFDAPPEYWPYTQVVVTPEMARTAVRDAVAQGWIGIKVYRDLDLRVYDAVISEAARLGVPVVGHVPVGVGVHHALSSGQRTLEHLLGYGQALTGSYGNWPGAFDEAGMRALARETVRAGAWNCPTLEILRRSGRTGHQNRLDAVRVLHEEGAELLVGTDSGIGATVPGESLVQEMLQLTGAGIPPYEVLRDATADAARLLGRTGEFGVIRPGARADLVLVDENPLDDIRHLTSPRGVLLNGLWLDGG